MKIGEGLYNLNRRLYMPKAVAEALKADLEAMIEFHTDGERIYLVKKEES